MWEDPNRLAEQDQRGYTVLEALTPAPLQPSPSFARPNAFVCIDGHTYWVKGDAQQGLVAELIAGRLAGRLGAGPEARIIRVTPEALPAGGAAAHLEGVVVGIKDLPNTVNARELEPLMQKGEFRPGTVDAASRARVIVFQSWIGVGDAQVLVALSDGKVFSIDHGDGFGSTSALTDPQVMVTPIPGVSSDVGRSRHQIRSAVSSVESITDNDLLTAVSGVPSGPAWRSPADRRREIGRWLAYRRDRLREVMEEWLRE